MSALASSSDPVEAAVAIPQIRELCDSCYACFDPTWIPEVPSSGVDGFTVWTLYSFFFFPTLILYLWFRNVPSIKLRSPWLTMLGALCGFMIVTTYCAERSFRLTTDVFQFGYSGNMAPLSLNCAFSIINNSAFWGVFLLSYPMRAIRLLFIFRKSVFASTAVTSRQRSGTVGGGAEDRIPMVPGTDGRKQKPMSVARYRRMRKSKTMRFLYSLIPRSWADEGVLIAITLVVALIFVIISFIGDIDYIFGCVDCDSGVTMWLILLIFYAMIIAFLLISLFLLRHVQDEFTINTELRAVCVITLALAIPWGIISLLNAFNGHRYAFPHNYLAIILVIASNIVSLVMPLYQLVRSDKSDVLATCKKMMKENTIGTTLESVLENETATGFFAQYLATEFSSENLTFWDAIKFYKQRFDNTTEFGSATFIALAEAIFGQFLSEDGAMQINAPYEKVLAVRAFLDDTSRHESLKDLKHLYDPLITEVLQMMRLNSFPKFQESRFFRDMIRQLHHSDVDALKEAGMVELDGGRNRSGSTASQSSVSSGKARRGRRGRKQSDGDSEDKKKQAPVSPAVVPVTVHPPVARSQPPPQPEPTTPTTTTTTEKKAEEPAEVAAAPTTTSTEPKMPTNVATGSSGTLATGTPPSEEAKSKKHRHKKHHEKGDHSEERALKEPSPSIAPQDLEGGLKPVIEQQPSI